MQLLFCFWQAFYYFSAGHASVRTDEDDPERDIFSAHLNGSFHRAGETAAAGNGHTGYSDTANRIPAENFGKLQGVIDRVQLRTADQRYFAADEILMEVSVGISGAVGGNQEISVVKKRIVYGTQLNLDGEIAKTGRGGYSGIRRGRIEALAGASRTAAGKRRRAFCFGS